jgi:hypothetical protein
MMKMLRWNAFQQCFRSRSSCWKHCINAEGDYFKGDGGEYKFQLVVKLWQRNSGNFWVAPCMKFSQLWKFKFRSSETRFCVVCSGFCRNINEICALLTYAAYSGNSILTFWDSLSVPPSRIKKSKKNAVNTWVNNLYGKRCGHWLVLGKHDASQ